MRRREFIASTAAATTVAIAGCSGGGGGPKGTVKQMVNAMKNGNAEKVNSLYHPDAQVPEVTSQQLRAFEEANINLQGMEIVEQSETQAVVEARLQISFGGESTTSTSRITLRKHQGQWLLYSGTGVSA